MTGSGSWFWPASVSLFLSHHAWYTSTVKEVSVFKILYIIDPISSIVYECEGWVSFYVINTPWKECHVSLPPSAARQILVRRSKKEWSLWSKHTFVSGIWSRALCAEVIVGNLFMTTNKCIVVIFYSFLIDNFGWVYDNVLSLRLIT